MDRVAASIWITVMVLVTIVAVVHAQRPDPGPATPKAMNELDALKIGKLYAERQVFEQALLRLQAQQENLRLQTQSTRRDLEDTNRALQTMILTAAREAGLTDEDLKQGWQPAPERREWVKGAPPAQP